MEMVFNIFLYFNFAHGAMITYGAYLTYFFSKECKLPFLFSSLMSLIGLAIISLFIETVIFKKMRNKNLSSLNILIASLGIYIVLQNLISLFFKDDAKSIRSGNIKIGHNIFGAYITEIQIILITSSISIFCLALIFLKYSKLGKKIRAVSSNKELSIILGINTDRVILVSFIIGSTIAGMSGILIALDLDMTPTMGFKIFMYGIIAMIIGGVGSTKGLIWGACILAFSQHFVTFFIDSKWADAIAFIILILFLIWKPLGFSGKLLKKTEI